MAEQSIETYRIDQLEENVDRLRVEVTQGMQEMRRTVTQGVHDQTESIQRLADAGTRSDLRIERIATLFETAEAAGMERHRATHKRVDGIEHKVGEAGATDLKTLSGASAGGGLLAVALQQLKDFLTGGGATP